MLPDQVSNPGPLTHESGVLPIALRGPAGKSSETGSIKSQISFKTSRGKKGQDRKRTQRLQQRQPGEQPFPIQVVAGLSNI